MRIKLVEDHYFIRFAVLLVCMLLIFGIILRVNSILYYMIAINFGIFFCYILSGMRLDSPGVWFVAMLALYGFSLPILDDFGYYDTMFRDDLITLVVLFICVVFFGSIFVEFKHSFEFSCNGSLRKDIDYLYDVVFIVQLCYLLFSAILGASKVDAQLAGIYRLSIIQQWFIFHYTSVIFCNYMEKKLNYYTLFNAFVLSIASSLITGERDIVVGVVVTTAVVISLFRSVSYIWYIVASVSGLFVFTVLQSMRNIFSSDFVIGELGDLPFWVEVLIGEPASASKNLDKIISYTRLGYDGEFSFFYVDVLSIFIPKFIIYIENSENWFNKTFYGSVVDIGGGVGFGLIANFYLYGGFWGVVVFSALLSYVIFLMRFYAYKSFFVMIMFVSSIPITIHSIRSDLAAFIGAPLRGVLLPCLLLYYINRLKWSDRNV